MRTLKSSSGIMVPTIRGVMIQIKQTRTETTGTNLRNAISAYFTEYRRLPYDFREHTGEAVFLQSDEKLMNILCGMDSAAGDNGLNPSRNIYFSDRNARKLGQDRYHSGQRIDAGGNAYLYDPWGEYYQVILDGDANGRVTKPTWDETTASHEITSSILVWSKGPDKETEGEDDNIKVW